MTNALSEIYKPNEPPIEPFPAFPLRIVTSDTVLHPKAVAYPELVASFDVAKPVEIEAQEGQTALEGIKHTASKVTRPNVGIYDQDYSPSNRVIDSRRDSSARIDIDRREIEPALGLARNARSFEVVSRDWKGIAEHTAPKIKLPKM